MNRNQFPMVWGVLLIVAGVLFLLQSLGVLAAALAWVWLALFVIAGAAFLYVFLTDRTRWWAVIPAFALLGLGALMALNELFPKLGDIVGGPIFLTAIGAGFVIIYFTKREHWWAIIPSGVMLTVAVTAAVENLNPGFDTGGLVLLGLGCTFLVLSFLETPQGRIRWALIPAGVLLLIGFLIIAETVAAVKYIWPAALILGGVYFVLRSFLPSRKVE